MSCVHRYDVYDAELFAVARPLLPFKTEPSAAQLQASGLLTADLTVADVVPLPGGPLRWTLPNDESGASESDAIFPALFWCSFSGCWITNA